MTEHVEVEGQRWTPPWLYLFLEMPFGAAIGFLMIAVPYRLSAAGIPLAEIATVSAVGFMPHALKIFWVPVIDMVGRRKTWYLGMVGITAALLAAASLVPDPARHLGLLTVLVTALQAAAATTSAALNALIAMTTHPDDKGKAGGFYMAGNVGGTGILGALALWLSTAVAPWVAGLALAGVVVASGAGAVTIHEPVLAGTAGRPEGGVLAALGRRIAAMVRDLWETASSLDGFTALVISVAPVGCGALTNLFSGMAIEYGADQHVVEVVNGLGGGIAGALGSLAGGFLADRMNRRLAYALAGGLTALSAVGMLLAPMTPTTYAAGTLAYNFANGVAFATWAGMVLEVVGPSAAVATKYALFVASSNFAISTVTKLDGWASGFRGLRGDWAREAGARGALAFDAGITALGIVIVLLLVRYTERRKARLAAASAAP
ncbi:MAG TPA: MFS transporter [Anaeromyxobacteraceae bacterium]|nr:MFS transporter [Anaeromyxobacteraceae bacterium]